MATTLTACQRELDAMNTCLQGWDISLQYPKYPYILIGLVEGYGLTMIYKDLQGHTTQGWGVLSSFLPFNQSGTNVTLLSYL